jgi:hypothetical protein
MTFTDDDLKELDEDLIAWADWQEWADERANYADLLLRRIKGLRERLLRAEAVCEARGKGFIPDMDGKEMKAWRKAKGDE